MEYTTMFLIFFAALVILKVSSWILKTAIKLAFTAGFLTLIFLVMSSSVGLF